MRLRFCYEAGPTGYGLKRQLKELGHDRAVIAPSLIPRRPGERVKPNRCDAVKLARLFRAGELTEIWTPDEANEAMRDLVGAREAPVKDRTCKRQEIRSFLLRHGKVYPGRKAWGTKYFKWLHTLSFAWPAQHADLKGMNIAETQCRERVARLERAIEDSLLDWSLAPVVERLQALRGVGLIAAVTFMVDLVEHARIHGRCARGERPRMGFPHGHRKTTTLVAGLRLDGMVAPMVLEGSINADWFEDYIAQILAPTLRPGDVVIMDNLSSQKRASVRAMIEARSARLSFLPPYSPDFNPKEMAFAKLKALLRKAADRTVDGLWTTIGRLVDVFTPNECAN